MQSWSTSDDERGIGSKMARRRNHVVQISSRAYRMARLAAGILGEEIVPPIVGADDREGRVTVRVNKKAYHAAQLLASLTNQPVADVVERILVAHAEHVIEAVMGPVQIPSDPEDN
jgi:hypothetical protein